MKQLSNIILKKEASAELATELFLLKKEMDHSISGVQRLLNKARSEQASNTTLFYNSLVTFLNIKLEEMNDMRRNINTNYHYYKNLSTQ